MEPFCFTVDDFDVEWLLDGPRAGMSRGFSADTRYQVDCTGADQSEEKDYDLRVNHPLAIGDTEVFLIGHGYAPVITVRDGNGDVVTTGPTVFLPQDQSLFSFGVVKAAYAATGQVGLEGVLYPTFMLDQNGDPQNLMGEPEQPADLDARLHRRPGPRQRRAAVALHPEEGRRRASAATRTAPRCASTCRVGETVQLPDGLRQRHVRGHPGVEPPADQQDAG